MTPSDWPAVREIYREGIATGNATFETEPPDWEAFDSSRLAEPRIVAVDAADRIVGWAVLSPVSSRCVYGGVAEVSVYVAAAARGTGVGSTLMEALIEQSESLGLWTLQAGIFPENAATIALHRKFGFREVGRREKIGKHEGRWRDTLLLERRSPAVGGLEAAPSYTFDWRRDEQAEAVTALTRRRLSRSPLRWVIRLFWALLLFTALFTLLMALLAEWEAVLSIGGLTLACAGLLLAMPKLVGEVRARALARADVNVHHPITFRLLAKSLRVELHSFQSELTWKSVPEIGETDRLVLIHYNELAAFYLPKRAVGEAKQVAQLVTDLRERIGAVRETAERAPSR